jgi:hypothetical protein
MVYLTMVSQVFRLGLHSHVLEKFLDDSMKNNVEQAVLTYVT